MTEQRSLGGSFPGIAGGIGPSAGNGAGHQDADDLAAVPDSEFTLLELADRLLNKGVVLVGEATISVAGVDLIYLGLNVVLTSVENLKPKKDGADPSLRSG